MLGRVGGGLVDLLGVSADWCGWVGCGRRMSGSRWVAAVVRVKPGQPREARSSTAHTSDSQLVSPASRPMTLMRRRVWPKVRSMKLECRIRCRCSWGNCWSGQRLLARLQATHRGWERGVVGGGEGLHSLLDNSFGPLIRFGVGGDVEGRPVGLGGSELSAVDPVCLAACLCP
jgi:hypothetical protein